jgi:TolB-like protein/tetratricopeptide (TPR) repeat protein
MPTVHKFGPFRLDAKAEILFRGGEPVALGQRAVALLRVLVEQAGVPVSKDALIEAAWPGLAVEDSNLTVQIAALRRVLGEVPGGEDWIETLPRRGYRFTGPTVATGDNRTEPVTTVGVSVTPPDMPSIAVLPFQNMSGDPEQEYFADGIVEEIITALSRFRHLIVMARNSSFTYKNRVVDVKEAGRALGVRYVLEGSVRKAGDRVRIAGQLIEASTGRQLWTDRLDGSLKNIFDLQDQVTASVVGAIAPMVEQAEIDRARRKPTENLDAHDLFLRGMAKAHQQTDAAIGEALQLFYKAIELDSGFGSAYGMAAYCLLVRRIFLWTTDPAKERAETARLARRAAETGWDDALALARAGHALATGVGDYERAAAMIDRARNLNPNLAVAWYASGWLRNVLGEPETAIEHFAYAMRLSPLDPEISRMQAGMAFALFVSGRYDEALDCAQTASLRQPGYLTPIEVAAASAALAGRLDVARTWVERLREINPKFSVSDFKNLRPLRRQQDLAKLEEGLRKAGLPD